MDKNKTPRGGRLFPARSIRAALTAAVAAGSAVLAGCGVVGSGADDPEDGTLTIGLASDISTLDPWMTRTVTNDLNVLSQIYTPLVSRGADLELQPELAESWQQVDDLTWRFDLRGDVEFANGKQLDAEVVAWNINSIIDPDTGARTASTLASVTEATAVDDTTVEIGTESPDASVPDHLTTIFFVEPTWRAEHDPAREAMGSGPYELMSWKLQNQIVLQHREDAGWTGKPGFPTVKYQIIPEESARIASLRTGAIDLTVGFGVDQMGALEAAPGIKTGSTESSRVAFLYADATKEPMDDARVRQAINYAIDKDSIVDQLLRGSTSASPGQVITESYGGFDPISDPYPHDPEQARRLLAEAGYPEGLAVDLIYPTGSPAVSVELVAQAIAADLSEVGVRLSVSSMPNADFVNMNYERTSLPALGYMTYSWWTLDGADLLENFSTGGAQQFWVNTRFDELIHAARAESGDRRAELTRQAVREMREDAGFVFLFPQPITYAHSDAVGFSIRPDEWLRAAEIGPVQ